MRSTFKVLFYLKRNKDKDQKVVPVMGRITVNGSIAQFSAKLGKHGKIDPVGTDEIDPVKTA